MNPSPVDESFEALLMYIKSHRGFDFTGYKRSTLTRRFERRMQQTGVDTYAAYQDYLEVHPDEFTCLFNTILINVTSFFRDPQSWDYLAEQIVPRILASKGPHEPVRVWSAGCASGQEPYTAAMVLAEALGTEAFPERVKIYATDVDEEALNAARAAVYAEKEMVGLPEPLLAKYFERARSGYIFRKEVRRSVIFGRHDLAQDAPISKVDLLICRNTLMYFNAEAQARILARLHFALRDSGFLFLGRAEMLLTHGDLFAPVELRHRVFMRVPKENLRERMAVMSQSGNTEGAQNHLARQSRLRDAAFETAPAAQILVDLGRHLTLANERARALFGIAIREVGMPTQELDFYRRLGDLRAAIEHAFVDRRPVALTEVEWPISPEDGRLLNMHAIPLLDADGTLLGVSAGFQDVTQQKRLQHDLEHARHELETAYEELQSTNEELETTNEELQSTTEELETTNEELQSTNEELETMNEELQSTNQELETMNDELRVRSHEAGEANAYLQSVLTGLRAGVAVLDREQRVRMWNQRAEDLWGARADEVKGEHFLNLDIGLPVERLRQPIRAGLSGETYYEELTLDATNRRGKPVRVRATTTPLTGRSGEVDGVILLMEEIEAATVGHQPPRDGPAS